MLRDVRGLSTKEAAAVLGISEGAVKVRLHRAHARLRELIDR
jgi:RNA polymerase sigma-70 factor (ECF subfamily)